MRYVLLIIFIIIFIANQAEKNKKKSKTISAGSKNAAPQPGNNYQVNMENNKKSKSNRAFMESNAYSSGNTVNEQIVSRENVIDALTEFNASIDRQNKQKGKKSQKTAEMEKRADSISRTVLQTGGEVCQRNGSFLGSSSEYSYGFSIFDDFAASDALYLARKDVEERRAQEISAF